MGEIPDRRPNLPHGERERRIEALAAKQYGLVTRQQLLRLGMSSRQVERRRAARRLISVHAGVYAVGHVERTPLAKAMAAVLACGRDAAVSHGSAASLWGLTPRWTFPVEVVSPRDHRLVDVMTHRSSTLTRADIRVEKGIRVTSIARTLLDVAPRTPAKHLTRMANDALRSRRLRQHELDEVVKRCPRHPGATRLRPFTTPEHAPTASGLEDEFLALLARYGLPMPLINATVAGYEVDAFFPPERLIVELDSWRFHGDRRAFENDRERDAATLAAGCATMRMTWERLRVAPEREAARLEAVLRARRA